MRPMVSSGEEHRVIRIREYPILQEKKFIGKINCAVQLILVRSSMCVKHFYMPGVVILQIVQIICDSKM